MRECRNCGCFNEPEQTEWRMVWSECGYYKYPEAVLLCPVCGSEFPQIKDIVAARIKPVNGNSILMESTPK